MARLAAAYRGCQQSLPLAAVRASTVSPPNANYASSARRSHCCGESGGGGESAKRAVKELVRRLAVVHLKGTQSSLNRPQQPIIFMQCGPIRHTAARLADAIHDLEVLPRSRFAHIDLPPESGIQEVFRHLANDRSRTAAIAAEVGKAFGEGRKVLVLTERTEHLEAMQVALGAESAQPFVLHGRMCRKRRATLIAELDALPPDAPRILLATGKLVGEGFDHPPLDTLVLAMPISWKGTLQQYAGRLHREHAGKADVRIIDFVDTGHPALVRMWDKRQRGYRAMGYAIRADVDPAGTVAAQHPIGCALQTRNQP